MDSPASIDQDLLSKYGLKLLRAELATSEAEAVRVAKDIGFPVALKIHSPDIYHKTDVGGVELGIEDEAEVSEAYVRIMQRVTKSVPDARIEGVLVQEMAPEGHELIIGVNRDRVFGPSIMVGLGGILTELLGDVSFRLLPITASDAAEMLEELRGAKLLSGYRGMLSVSKEMLINLLLSVAKMGLEIMEQAQSVDLNPVVVWGDEHRIVDFKVEWAKSDYHPVGREPNTLNLEKFFNPRSVALYGVSATPGKLGNYILDSLVLHDYRGNVYPIHPSLGSIMGIKVYRSLLEVPEPVDVVVIAIPLGSVPEVMRQCAVKGVRNMVIISGGGKESSGKDAESEIRALSNELGIRVIGCNCIGIFDGFSRFDTFFQTHERMTRPRKGSVAMITQSGTVGLGFLEAMADVGVSKFVSYGNRIDVDEGDLITFLSDDPETSVIGVYIEGLEDGRKFYNAVKKAVTEKPVVVFKAGRTAQAERAAVSHTGFLAGTYRLAAGAFRQAGALAVDSVEELEAACKALAMQPRAKGNRVLMITNGAGATIQAIDLMEMSSLELAMLSEQSRQDLKKHFSPFVILDNPVDLTGSATAEDFRWAILVALNDPGVDVVMPWFVLQDTPLDEGIVSVVKEASALQKKPIVCGAIGGDYTRRMASTIENVGVPVFLSVKEWVAAARALAHFRPQ